MSAATDQSSSATRVATSVQQEEPKTSESVPDSPLTVMPNLRDEDNVLTNASTARKLTLMALFSAAQFLDAFNTWSVHTIAPKPQTPNHTHPRTFYTARCSLRSPTSLKGSRLLLRRRRG